MTKVDDWTLKLPKLVTGYAAKDIYDMDVPDKSLNVKGETCTGGKKSKEHITVSLCEYGGRI